MKRVMSIALVLVLVLSVGAMQVYAEDTVSEYDWYVHFTSSAGMESNYSPVNDTTMSEAVSGLQPGDSMTFYMDLVNQYAGSTDWYMENAVIRSLEENKNLTQGGAYTYELFYDGPSGRQTLFNSDTVGGEQAVNQSGRTGLEQATSALEDFFYLDTLAYNQSGTLTLKVALDGESQGNIYQDTLAQLRMNFAVELNDTTPDRPWQPVRTGDETNLLLWSGIMLGCGLAALALGIYTLRRNRRDRKEDKRHE